MKKVAKANRDLAPSALPHGNPVECTTDYFRSKNQCASAIRKFPVWDVARPEPTNKLRHSALELMNANADLAKSRQTEAERRASMDRQWADLRAKQLILKDSFISFNKFIRENQEKVVRADQRIAEDCATLARKTQDTEALQRHVLEMKRVKEAMERQVREYSIYEDYLIQVCVNNPTEFKQPIDVLNRYEALADARSSLAAKQEEDLENLERARREMATSLDENQLSIMGLNNKLASLRWEYGNVRRRSVSWSLALNRLKDVTAQKTMEFERVSEAIWTLYQKICKSKGLPAVAARSDYEHQLVVVMRALMELRRIYRITQERVGDATDTDHH